MDFYKTPIVDSFEKLQTLKSGLSKTEAEKRLKKYGPNETTKPKKLSEISLFLSQFKNFIVYVLIFAAVVSYFVGEEKDAIVIGVIIILNVCLGFFQEYNAEKSIEALRKLSNPKSIVLRDGKTIEIDSKDIVIGDIILIEEGSYIPADARVIESNSLVIDESTFSGESAPVSKSSKTIEKECTLADRVNIAYAGTLAVRGRGRAVVFATGMNTEIGKIAQKIEEEPLKTTPLQKQLNSLGVYITILILLICAIIVLIQFYLGKDLFESFLVAVALSVAAIPEGLPAVITITLALGTQRMVKKNALIRRLPAVETLGSTTVICTDKTGTITKNEMTVTKIFSCGKILDATGTGYNLEGEFLLNGKKLSDLKEHKFLFEAGLLCNNAIIDGPSDPTEKAILVASKKSKFNPEYKRIEEVPFSSEEKYMLTIHQNGNEKISYAKGAPEVILSMCSGVYSRDKIIPLNSTEKKKIEDAYFKMASDALRVIALAYNPKGNKKDLIFLGLMGMIDPPRENVKESIEQCKIAGIKVVMITGDHSITAKAIAKEVGIIGKVITGQELDNLDEKEFEKEVEEIGIYARVSPENKRRIVKTLKNKGHIVAMIGDGVNDATALKLSDIGTSVGSGTEVSKQASDMVLLDDNFTSIVLAVMEGRSIFSNIKKFINFLFSCNLSEVLVIFLALLIGFPLPLIAIQILWMNLLTDGLPALALGIDPTDKNEMRKPPRKKNEKIIQANDLQLILSQAFIMTAGVLFLFNYYLPFGLDYARTVAFFSLVMFQLFNVFNYRAGEGSIFSGKFFENRFLLLAVLFSVILQFAAVEIFTDVFETVSLKFFDVLFVVLVSSSVLLFFELIKLIKKFSNNSVSGN
ncbi:MAG: calcium-translocating P-type ATPase, PMCA-type [Candidatus Micrarchaeia archaeon]